MNTEQAKKIVITAINDALKNKAKITEDMQLIGGESLLDSPPISCISSVILADWW